ncbi:MAG: hypothetical protein ACUVRZ_10865 [Desulfobacca sp.]|uniref:hypothetical protein n=1 Tax=Desulfobacca sp. TaxID=2067990 RepID=UPI0040498739
MGKENYEPANPGAAGAQMNPPRYAEVFGVQVPLDRYYVHRGPTWVRFVDHNQVQVGIDDIAQKVFGPAEALALAEPGDIVFQDHICLAWLRAGQRARLLAPVAGLVEEINAHVLRQPRLRYNLANLLNGEAAAWLMAAAHRLLARWASERGVTLPDGGTECSSGNRLGAPQLEVKSESRVELVFIRKVHYSLAPPAGRGNEGPFGREFMTGCCKTPPLRESLYLGFWQRQKAKLGFGEGCEGRGLGPLPPPLIVLLQQLLGKEAKDHGCENL